ncbi:hypothetical protein QAD02_020458 [Eretmocerus hayati]|uniref:Uncharacterized protein n=1 Tax=Eretmocerus hayati TaxID=131215 RepID=A0ACC2PMK5_9HYME|nr:hypothetical protein QAD02_020458 [Eretmocerus hayati]
MEEDSRRLRKTLSMKLTRKRKLEDTVKPTISSAGADIDDGNGIKSCAKQESQEANENLIPVSEVESSVNNNGSSIDSHENGEIDVQVPHECESTPREDSSPYSHYKESNTFHSSAQGNLRNSSFDDQDSEGEDPSPVDKESILADILEDWATETNIANGQVDSLLQKLKPHFTSSSASQKTLLNMNSDHMFEVRKFDPHNESDKSMFVYFGLKRILEIIVKPRLHVRNPVLKLQFNADGMKLNKSSPLEFWAMQGKIHTEDEVTYDPFLINFWHGEGKPSSADLFLEKFANESLSEGIHCLYRVL